jgi:hypothetical protein
MTEFVHIHCDRCGKTTTIDSRNLLKSERGWAICRVEFERRDFCPPCWQIILSHSQNTI